MKPTYLFLSALLFCVMVGLQTSQAEDRPNFMILIADDMTWSDLGYEGNSEVDTPNLDQLHRDSMHLTQMFTPATTCSPSRHALYTGLFSMRSGAYPNHTRVYQDTKSVFTYLKNRGYRVALQNKSHVGPPQSFPYEHIVGADDLTATEEFITRDDAQPWLLVYASNDPHSPWSRGPSERYDPAKLTLPVNMHDNETTRKTLANYYAEISKFDEQVGNMLELLKRCDAEENTLVMFLSEQGNGLPNGGKWTVYDTGIRVSTLVRWPGRVKPGSSSDALIQYVDVVPTFLEAAGIDPQTVEPSCPDAFGNKELDGRSFLSVLTGKSDDLRDYVFSQHTTVGINGYKEPYPMRAVRDDRYKLIRNLAPENTYEIHGIHKSEVFKSWIEDAKTNPRAAKLVNDLYKRPGAELFDLKNDPLEQNNLAGKPEYAEIQQKLRLELDQWMKQQGDQGMETEKMAHSRQGNRQKKKGKKAKANKA